MQHNNTRNTRNNANGKDVFVPPKFNFQYAIPQPSKTDYILEINALETDIVLIDRRIEETQQAIAKIDTSKTPEHIAAIEDVEAKDALVNEAQKAAEEAKAELNAVGESINKLRETIAQAQKEAKNIKSFNQLKTILDELNYVQAHTSLDNSERREIQKEISALSDCKAKLARIDSLQAELVVLNNQRDLAKKILTDKINEVNAAKKLLGASKAALNDVKNSAKSRYDSLYALKGEVNALKKQKNEIFAKKLKVKNDFKKVNTEWYEEKNQAYEKSREAHTLLVNQLREEWESRAEERKQQRRKKQLENAKVDPNVETIVAVQRYKNYLLNTYDPKKDTAKNVDMTVYGLAGEANISEVPSTNKLEEIVAICDSKIEEMKSQSVEIINKKVLALEEAWAAEDRA